MKLRLCKNSIRFRLLRNEVDQLCETGEIAETIEFGISRREKLTYSVRKSAAVPEVLIQCAHNRIEILLPTRMIEDWADTDLVGLYSEQKAGGMTDLTVVIEKDFVCLDSPKDTHNATASESEMLIM